MKRKIIPLFALAVLTLSTVVACGGEKTSTNPSSIESSISSTTSSEALSESSKSETSSEVASSSEAHSSESTSSSEEITPTAPTMTIAGEKAYTVVAGQELTLPTVSAQDYLGKDLTAAVELEDLFENNTINGSTFKALTAGVHKIAYYVEDEGGRFAEDEVQITVTPVNPETFDTTGFTDPTAISTYGTFKENYEKGKKAPLAAVMDSNNAGYLTATEEAINGNSLVLLPNQTAGSAANSYFMSAFNDSFVRGKATTYKVSFKFKILAGTAADLSNFYFGLSWDAFTGLNNAFVNKSCEVGKVYDYSCSFPATEVATTGNAYFMFFKLTAASTETKIAIDDFTVSSEKCAETTKVTPTAEQLSAEGGFTWNWADKGASCTSGETILVENIEDETVRNEITADDGFGSNAMKLINADSHLFSGLTKDNMIVGKKLIVDFKYYAVNGNGFNLIMMGDGGNPTLAPKVTGSGKIKTVHLEVKIEAGWNAFNIYGAGNPSFNIILGNLTAKITEPDPVVEDQTPKGYKVGKEWNQATRHFGTCSDASRKVEAFDGNATVTSSNTKMGSAPQKVSFVATNTTIEWKQFGGEIEVGQEYEITLDYYMESWAGGRFMYNFDNSAFLEVGTGDYTSVGFHSSTIKWTATKSVDFFSFYLPGDGAVPGVFYVGNLNVKLVAIHN